MTGAAVIHVERAFGPTTEVRALVGALDTELSALSPPEQRHGLALDAIFEPHVRFFLAYRDDLTVGCGGLAFFPDFAEVKRMFVRPEARGTGAADAIMARLVGAAAEAGLTVLRLETGANFARAIGFYRRWGFSPCSIFEPYASKPPHTVAASLFLERLIA
ncbi:MAG TPA: GNAT family N-acetyltransferase [Rhizomicrobium sp.]|nr:GNAT family N-acetyltransferase [Rhizomicrobium sp.]